MPWARLDDRLQMSVKIRGLADDGVTGDRKKDQINGALGHFIQLLTWVAGAGTDGFVTADVADLFGTAATTRRLLRARFGRQPLLHQLDEHGKPPKCPCLDGREWKPDFEFLIHDYLDRNPAKAEVDVKRAKDRELRNSALKAAVRLRDRDTCRYCGVFCPFSDRVSDDGLTYDHVDPEIAGGMGNLVIACRGCNRKKGKRTPFQAGMVLLDLPTTGPVTVAGLVTGPVTGPVTGLVVTPGAATTPAPDGADVREHVTEPGTTLPADQRRDGSSSQVQRSPGRDGDGLVTGTGVPSTVEPPPSVPIGPPPPRLTGRPGNPYLRESRPFPDLHAGHPPQPGDDPATERLEAS
ncbi:HNH endonuclease [Amycolatopsis sp. NPDC051128]|uniref:HNH endonuclease n=1 Tax=Amycolatopsis sp. NPDC051128 TaxID=3155412 RepID=UPI0034406FFE